MKPKAEIAWVHLPLREDRPSGRSARDGGCFEEAQEENGRRKRSGCVPLEMDEVQWPEAG